MPYIGNVGDNDTVDTDQLKDGAVTAAKVAADVATQAELDLKSPLASPSFTGTVTADGLVVKSGGTTVGSIQSRAGAVSTIILDPRAGGAGLSGKTGTVVPTDNVGNLTTGVMDLGHSSERFKDLYLSGGVVFGATGGSVSSKTLDDYEEGTWTGTVSGSTSGPTAPISQTGQYTKIGNVVTVRWRSPSSFNNVGAVGQVHVNGLPFASSHEALGSTWGTRCSSTIFNVYTSGGGSSRAAMLSGVGGSITWASNGTSGTYLSFSLTYLTAS